MFPSYPLLYLHQSEVRHQTWLPGIANITTTILYLASLLMMREKYQPQFASLAQLDLVVNILGNRDKPFPNYSFEKQELFPKNDPNIVTFNAKSFDVNTQNLYGMIPIPNGKGFPFKLGNMLQWKG